MEIASLIGMLAAFFAGAYVRQPVHPKMPQTFWGPRRSGDGPRCGLRAGEPGSGEAGSITQEPVSRASAEAEAERRKREEDRIAQLQNMLNYIGRGSANED